ncbi:MAG: ABC transporter permease [Plesiomonas sp.]|uniref:ABC transporter permease n=1 Tax=Plesiomonas sp. TaxID=2486279 RepID=UPI003F330F2E
MRMPSFVKILLGNPKALVGSGIIVAFILLALSASMVTTHVPDKRVGRPHEAPSAEHVMGTTRMGRDVMSQVIHGGRISLAVGFGAGIIVCTLAVAMGVTAGYFGGKIDEVLTFFMNVMLVIPQLPLLFVLAAFIGQASPLVITLIIGLTSWAWGARVVRAQTMSLREKEFVKAAELLGEPSWRIILVEILPNLMSIIGASFIGSVMYAIMTEATLEYLGLGDPNVVSWGIMLYNVQTSSSILVGAWWEVIAPCVALMILVVGLALLNFAVDEIANPQLRSHKGMQRWKSMTNKKQQPEGTA